MTKTTRWLKTTAGQNVQSETGYNAAEIDDPNPEKEGVADDNTKQLPSGQGTQIEVRRAREENQPLGEAEERENEQISPE